MTCFLFRYFYHAFLGTVGAGDGATLMVEGGQHHNDDHLAMRTASGGTNAFSPLDDHPNTGAIASPQPELRRSGRVFFRESSTVLERIVEFMYLGQIAMLEESAGCPSEDQYNTWMWLLTWCVLSSHGSARGGGGCGAARCNAFVATQRCGPQPHRNMSAGVAVAACLLLCLPHVPSAYSLLLLRS
jgi:hypothetical protein